MYSKVADSSPQWVKGSCAVHRFHHDTAEQDFLRRGIQTREPHLPYLGMAIAREKV